MIAVTLASSSWAAPLRSSSECMPASAGPRHSDSALRSVATASETRLASTCARAAATRPLNWVTSRLVSGISSR